MRTMVARGVAALTMAAGLADAQQTGTVRVRVDTTDRDAPVRVFVTGAVDAERMTELLRELQRVEAEVRADLMAARAAGEADRAGALARRLQELTARRFSTGSQLALWCAKEAPVVASTEGWLGVTFADAAVREHHVEVRDGVRTAKYRFTPAPAFEQVTPGSPAAKAGVREGDVLLAINGVAIGDELIDFGTMLKPGTRLPLRLRRDGVERTVTLTVEKRPPSPEAPCEARDFTLMVPSGEVVAPRTPAPPRPRTATAPALRGGTIAGFTFSTAALAGAQLESLDDEKRELTGARAGMFVARVAPGSPAAAAGLKWGDVIVKAGGAPVTEFAAIRDALARAGGQPIVLEVTRLGKTRTVRLLGRGQQP